MGGIVSAPTLTPQLSTDRGNLVISPPSVSLPGYSTVTGGKLMVKITSDEILIASSGLVFSAGGGQISEQLLAPLRIQRNGGQSFQTLAGASLSIGNNYFFTQGGSLLVTPLEIRILYPAIQLMNGQPALNVYNAFANFRFSMVVIPLPFSDLSYYYGSRGSADTPCSASFDNCRSKIILRNKKCDETILPLETNNYPYTLNLPPNTTELAYWSGSASAGIAPPTSGNIITIPSNYVVSNLAILYSQTRGALISFTATDGIYTGFIVSIGTVITVSLINPGPYPPTIFPEVNSPILNV